MIKSISLLITAFALSCNVNAQHNVKSLSLQPKIGVGLSKLTNHYNSDFRTGLVVGFETEYQIKPKLGLSAGLLYSQQGAKYSLGDENHHYEYNYFNIPVLANFYVAKNLALKVGLQLGLKSSSKDYFESSGWETSRVNDNIRDVDVALPLGISYELGKFVADARYNFGLTEVRVRSQFSVFQFTLGYRFDLIKGKTL
ncbi:MAG: PorT family protein [Prevotella shahii]|nr:PorT family protein [Hoylesella shahii]